MRATTRPSSVHLAPSPVQSSSLWTFPLPNNSVPTTSGLAWSIASEVVGYIFMRWMLLPRRYHSSLVSANSQITHFVRLGLLDVARKVFDELPNKNVRRLLECHHRGLPPKQAACRKLFDRMPERNLVSWNGLLSGYIDNGMIAEARKVFDQMPHRNVVSWTAMVKGYAQEGMVNEAERLFWEMPERNVVSWTVIEWGLIEDGRVEEANMLFNMMPVKDVVARTNMLNGLCSVGRLSEARLIFDEMPMRNVVAWTTMISGYAMNGKVDLGRKLFEVAPRKNEVTWTAMLTGYARCGRIEEAAQIFELMPVKPIVANNEMILGYGKNGEVKKARSVFDKMHKRDDRTLSAMIKVYERNGFELEALNLFRLMVRDGVMPHFPSLISILSICGSLASLDHGKQVHAHLVRHQFDLDIYISSVLIAMYIRCGDLVKGKSVFDMVPTKDVVMWNSMITGYAHHGLGEEALNVFSEMFGSGVAPDEVTFVGVLAACSHTGKVNEGLEIFESMKSKYSVDPRTEHYACTVDLLGRAGRLNEALDLIENMTVEADGKVWGALLGACRTHMKLDLAELAAKKLVQLEPENTGPYVLLLNIYACQGKWRDAAEIRMTMRARSIRKSPGCSWIEIEKKVHMFTGGDCTGHPEHAMILKMMEKLSGLLKDIGYCPDGSFVLHDVEEEEKVQCLRYHSEKLAVAYGLLKVPEGMPIRVLKNLRVCGDCHSAMKLIAKVTEREIILRDANRFHHFKDGSCSCKDYW